MFLTRRFGRSGAMMLQRGGDDELMPQVCAWRTENPYRGS
jgi:hypothetical protein